MSLIRISRDPDGTLELRGRAWQEDGSLFREILERSGEGAEGAFGRFFGRFLLLEGRTAPGPECTATGRDGRNPPGVPPIARPGTSQLVRRRLRASTRGLPVFTGALIQRTARPSWTETTNSDARS